jgi:CBS domain-containing protein
MTVGDVCNREVVYVNREVTVDAGCRLMRHYHVGSLVVVDEVGGKRVPVGMLTDRDIVLEVNAMDLDAKVITAGDIMPPDLIAVPESKNILDGIEVMRSNGLRRLPIVDEKNLLVGIVTIDDLLPVLAKHLSGIAGVVSLDNAREGGLRK